MITKMKKLTFLIYYKEYEAFLKRMQELGVLHVQTAQEGSVEPTSELEAKLKQTEHVKAWINRLEAMEATDVPLASDRSATDILLHLDEMDEARRVKETELQRLRKDEAALLPWGDFRSRCVSRGCRTSVMPWAFLYAPNVRSMKSGRNCIMLLK